MSTHYPGEENTSDDFVPEAPPVSQPPVGQVSVDLEANKPTVTHTILGITIAMFVLQLVSQSLFRVDYLAVLGAKINEAILQGQIWRLITPVLLHGSITHIFFNMYALLSIGRDVERFYGHKRYLALYLAAAFAGNVLSFLVTQASSYGASTAIFGLIAAEGIFIFRNRKFFRNSRAMLINIAVVIGINLFIVGMIPNIDNFGHLGGLVGGGLFAWLAGPLWGESGCFPQVKISDVSDKSRTLPVFLGVCLLFALVALLKFFF